MNFNFLGRFLFASNQTNKEGFQSSSPARKGFGRAKSPSFDAALQSSSFFAALRLWSQVISSLPIKFYKSDGDNWIEDLQSSLSYLFSRKPNRYQTKPEFFATMIMNLMGHGNAYALIDKQSNGEIISLLPLYAGQVAVKILKGGKKVFCYTDGTNVKVIPEEKVWHLKIFGNNVIGMAPLHYGANAIGLGLSAEERQTQVFDNASKPSGILTYDSEMELTDEQRVQLKKEFSDLKEGKENVLMTIESGWKYQQVGLNPDDIQLLETRKFQVEDVARFMDVPSVLINDTNSSTTWGSGIGEIVNGWVKLSVIPVLTNIQTSMEVNLHQVEDSRRTKIEFDLDELLKLSRKELAEAHQKEVNSAVLYPNEARAERRLPPDDYGNQLYINTALQPLSQHMANPENKGE
jgi:HK97 family phage portal protein